MNDLRAWVTGRLDRLEVSRPDTGVTRSDFDLDPHNAPAARTSFKPAAVLIGVVEHPEGPAVILTRRSDNLRNHTGQIALPGGRCDPGETPWQTALREAHEEIGLDPLLVTLAGLSTPYRTGTGYHITPVVGFIAPGFNLTVNSDEVADVFETPFKFLMDPANHVQHEREIPTGITRRFYGMTWEDRFIWGATAGILRALYDRLYAAVVV
jgi:8-oxo-dGTP pyrophosphatase MutT (NUDIX family)